MTDLAYTGKEKIALQSKVFRLKQKRKMPVLAMDLYKPSLKNISFDRILVNQAFFWPLPKKFDFEIPEKDAEYFLKILNPYLQMLNPNGQLFISSFYKPYRSTPFQKKLLLVLRKLQLEGKIKFEFGGMYYLWIQKLQ